jgi:acetolactate synthase-1/2/3 large subunit
MTSVKASDLLVRALENEGVEYIFGIPGEENLDFLESLRTSKIRLILTRHEQAAGFMAATYGRLTGKIGVALSTLGPGATNFVTAAAYAQLGGMPMLMISGQKPIKAHKQGRFQVVDICDMMRPLTKFTRQVVHANNLPALVREAVRLGEQERPGAVHLELPEDVAREVVDGTLPFEVHRNHRPAADDRSIEGAARLIEGARHPLILVGAAANRKHCGEPLRAFIDSTGIPFFNTQMGKGVVDERHPGFIGTAALSEHDYLHWAIGHADVIINVGHDVIEKPPFIMQPGGVKVIHVNFQPASVDDVYFPQMELIGDIGGTLARLRERVRKQAAWDLSYYAKVRTEVERHTAALADDARFPLIPQRLVADVRGAMPSDGIVALDNGLYKIWFARSYKAHGPNTLLLDNALATMGAGLPSAIAAKVVHPDRKVIAVCGDGGFMMNSQELETAVRLKLDLVVLILRDNAYGMIKWKQLGMGFKDFGLDYGNPDFVKYAEAYGAQGARVTSADGFRVELKRALSARGVQLLEVPIDYAESHRVLHEELKKMTRIEP